MHSVRSAKALRGHKPRIPLDKHLACINTGSSAYMLYKFIIYACVVAKYETLGVRSWIFLCVANAPEGALFF